MHSLWVSNGLGCDPGGEEAHARALVGAVAA